MLTEPTTPQLLFFPSTLIVSDSTTSDVHFFNAVTHCFPGATASEILKKLQGLLPSLPSSIRRVIVHVGTNDTILQQAKLTKSDFNHLHNFLKHCGKSVFISSPITTLGCGTGRFSRLHTSLHTWLQSTCRAHNVDFIDNFNLSVSFQHGQHPPKQIRYLDADC